AFRELIRSRQADLAALITAEHGKVASDAAGEVARGLEVISFKVALYEEQVARGTWRDPLYTPPGAGLPDVGTTQT
ncbi:MAG: hypothetical protein ACRDPO_00780, partial [Streptosporangiaceae bacterium]